MSSRPRPISFPAALITLAALVVAGAATAAVVTKAPKRVTNTTSGKNQNPSIDKAGKVIVFTSNVNQVSGVADGPAGTFDFDQTGNDFTPVGATPPNPSCNNCADYGMDLGHGNLFLWRLKKKGSAPANSFTQITFSTSGGFTANQLPDINQKGTFVVWDSDDDHVGSNADGSREIFLYDVKNNLITQVTDTTSGGTGNQRANLSENGAALVFDSSKDFAANPSCTLADGTTACSNADGNTEIMVLERDTGKLTQLTVTTGNGTSANLRGRISSDGTFVAFQTTRNFSGALPGGTACAMLDGTTPCDNVDSNGEIMLFDRENNRITQVTDSTCGGATGNERVEISKAGKYVTWQSACEAELNPAPACGDCNGNDEVFLADVKKQIIQQVTITDAGDNRVPRISGSGRYIVWESNRSFLGANTGHNRTLYVIKRNTKPGPAGLVSLGQVEEDAVLEASGTAENPGTDLTTIDFTGGFNSSVEQFAVSTNGRKIAFDNKKNVGNQEIFVFDRKK